MRLIRVLSALGVFVCFVLWVSSALAARNASGTMAGINGPYTAGSVISSSVINARFSDIETEITDSLNRSGKGGMLAALRGTDGTVTAPAFSFTSETGSGIYRIGSSNVGFSINQAKVGEWTANGYLSANGAVATPSLSFSNDTGSGLYRIGSNDIGFAINGVKKLELTSSLFTVVPNVSLTGYFSSNVGIGGAPSFLLDVVNSGATTSARLGSNFQVSLIGSTANGSGFAGNLQNDGAWKYINTSYGALVALSSANGNMEFYSAPSGTAGNAATLTFRASIGPSGLTVGSGGTATAQLNFGSCTTNAGTPSVCTATVATGAKCVANPVGTAASTDSVTNSVSGTTLTITIQNGVAKTINYICF